MRRPDLRPDLPGCLLFVAALALTVFALMHVASCSSAPSKGDTAALVQRVEALAFNGAVIALEVLDGLEARHLDSLKSPTPEDIAKGERALERLKRARSALELVEAHIEGNAQGDPKAALREAVEALRLIAAELKADGVDVPKRVTDGLQIAAAFAGMS